MKLLYISKHRYVKKADGAVYSTGAMGADYFRRFLSVFDSVTVIGYVQEDNGVNGRTTVGSPIADTDQVRFLLAPCGCSRLASLLTNRAVKDLAKSEAQTADAIACKSATGVSLGAKTAKKVGKPYLVEVVGCVRDALWNHGKLGKLMAYPSFWNLRRVVKRAPFVCYVTDSFLQSRYPTRGVSAGISDVALQPVDESILAKRLDRINYHAGPWKLGSAGAVNVSYKGQQFVIEALAKLKAQGRTDFEYHMAGGGDPAALKALAEKLGVSDQVVFEGSLTHEAMFAWLDDLDLYLQPSLLEGMPRALIEAMSRALPALGTKVGGIPELIGRESVFRKKGSDMIAKMLSESSKKQLMEQAADNFARAKDFEQEKLYQKRSAFYQLFANACEEKE